MMLKRIIPTLSAKEFFYLSNQLSLFRIVLTIPLAFALISKNLPIITILLIIGLSTDALDGYVARKKNQITELGKILDPLADKIIIGVNLIVLIKYYGFPIGLAVIILGRDILILIGSLFISRKIKEVLPSNFTGKITVNLIALDIICYIYGFLSVTPVLNIVVVFFVIVSLIHYGIIFYQYQKIESEESI
ncbi:MAG: hypothetical protein Kow00108_00670 [Calditrichia bacterium]